MIDLTAQSCACTNCGTFVGPLSNSTFEFYAEGAINNDLSNVTQGVCGIEIDFVPDHIWSVEMTLTSPSGQMITLIGSQSFQVGVTGPLTWSIDFVPCGDPAVPDLGFNDVWDNNQNWLLANPYSGSYYPHIGCLEDFNTGTVDGNWILTVDNSHPLSSVEIIDFNILFCEDEGLGCFECGTDAGTLNEPGGGKACQGDSTLILDLFPTFTGTAPDTTLYGYTFIIAEEDTIVGYDTIPNLMTYDAGTYTVCGMSYLLDDSLSFPTPNNTVTVTTLRDNLVSENPSFCGAITLDCFSIIINPTDTAYIIDTICLGDTLFVDTLVLDQTGIYQLDYVNRFNCDSIIIIDLTVQTPVVIQVQDTVCAEEPYFFNDSWLTVSGSYEDTLQTTVGCDSFVFLKFTRLDSIITNLEAAICKEDSFQLGNVYVDSTGIYTHVLTSESGCDSTLVLNLTVLSPIINIAPVLTLDCNNPTVQIDASGSIGEALSFEWLDIINAGAGIVAGVNEAILEVSLPGNYLLTLTDTLGGNQCDTLTIVVVGSDYSTPNISIMEDTIDCANAPIQIQTDVLTSITAYDWSGPDGFTAIVAEPMIDLPGNYTVTVTGSNGCTDSFSVNITADTLAPLITVAMADDTLTCSNTSVQLSASASVGTVTYNWTGPGGFDFNIPNPMAVVPGDYILTIEGENGCASDTTITVFQNTSAPIIQIQEDVLGCSPDTIQLFSSSNMPGSSFRWLGPNAFESFEQNPFITVPGFYGLTVTGPNGCTTVEFINIMADEDVPIINIISDTLGCAPDTIVLQSFSSVMGSSFAWSGPGIFTSGLSNPEVTEPGTYDLVVTAPNGCQTSSSIVIIENSEEAIVTIFPDTLGCLPDTILLQSFSSIAGSTYNWTGPGGFTSGQSNPEITEPGMYNLQVTAPNGCETIDSVQVEIDNEIPMLALIGDTIDCNTDTITLQGFSSIPNSEFLWTGPSGFNSVLQNPEVSESGVYNLTITAPNGCEESSSINIISDLAFPIVTIISYTLNCAPDTIVLQSFSSIPNSSYLWSGPNSFSSAQSNPEVTQAGNYALTVMAPNGCETISSTTVEADEEVPVINIINDTLGCAPDTIVLQSFSSVMGSSFAWTGPGIFTSGLSNPEVTEPGTYDLTVTAPNGCQTSNSIVVIENSEEPIVTISSDTLGCLPDTILLQSFSSIAGSTYNWTGPGGFTSAQNNPEISEPGMYNLQVTAPNGCETTDSVQVEIDNEIPMLALIGDTIDCNTDTITLQGFSSIPNSEFLWTGPSGFNSVLQNPEVSESGVYNLTITAPNGCEESNSINIISDLAFPIVSIISDTLNCAPDTIVLQSFSNIPNSDYLWSGPNSFSSAQSNPEVTQAGNYALTVTAPNGCETISSTTVEADEEVPVINIISDTLGCAPDTIVLQSFSSVTGSDFAWTGPGIFTSGLSNPEVTEPGTYDLVVTAPNGCQTSSSVVIIENSEEPIVTIFPDTLGCLPDTILLQSFSNIAGSTYNWTGPGGFTSGQSNPEITEPGMYNLQVTAPNGCETTDSVQVEIDNEIPMLALIGYTIDCNTDTITLQGFSSIPNSEFLWTGPSGFNSVLQNPEVSESGIYNLTVTAPNGCEESSSINIISDLAFPIVTIISDTLNCAPDTIVLQSFSSIPNSDYLWSGPNSFSSAQSNPEVTQAGNYALTVTAPNGCETISSTTVEADEEVPVINIISDTLGCAPDTIVLQSFSSVTGSSFAWTGPGIFTSGLSNPEVTEPGTYGLVVTAPNGCQTSNSIVVIENSEEPIVTILSDTLGCMPDTILLQSFSSIAGSTYNWTGPGGFTSGQSNPEITEPGMYNLQVTAPNGCETIDSVQVEIDNEIPMLALIGDTIDCNTDTITLQGFSSIPNSEFLWTGPSGFSSVLQNPEVSESGVYNLTITAPNGCEESSSINIISDLAFPIVTIISDTLSCAPDTIVLQSFSSIPNSDYLWSGPNSFSSAQSNPEVTQAGNYALTVTAPNGCETISSTTVEADEEVPIINIISDTLGCAPDTIVLQSFSSVTGSSFAWTGPGIFTSGLSNPEVTEPGTYDLTVTAPNGCQTSSSIVIIENSEEAIVTIFPDTLGCLPDTILLQSFSSIAGSTYNWTGPGGFTSGQSNPEITEPGMYNLQVTAPNGCETIDSVQVEIDNEIPMLALIGDTIDCNTDTITLQGFSSIPNSEFLWTGPSGFNSVLQNPEVSESGVYNLTITAPNGCEESSSINIISDLAFPIVSIISDTLNCAPDTIVLQSFSSIPNSDYLWTGPNSFSSAQNNPEVTQAGNYALTVTAPNGCETISSTTVEADEEVPVINIISDTLGCAPDTIILQSFSSVTGSSFAWTGPGIFTSGLSNPEVTEPGTYDLTVTAPNGCVAINSIEVTVDSIVPMTIAIGDTIDCTNDIRQLQGFTNVNNATFFWQGPGGFTSVLQNPVITQAGTYNLSVTGLNGCIGTTMTDLLDLSDSVNAEAIAMDSLDCETTSVLIDGSNSTSGNSINYTWLNDNNLEVGNASTLSVNTAGSYSLIVNDSITSCFDTIQVEVLGDTIAPLASINTIGGQSITCDDPSIILSAADSAPATNTALEWFYNGNSFSTLSDVEVENAGFYVLQITNLLNNCSDTDTFNVAQDTDLPIFEIMPPDIITCIDSIVEVDASASSSGVDYNAEWTSYNNSGIVNGQNSLLLLVNEPGTYTLTIENELTGCTDSASIVVSADLEFPVAVANVNEELDCFNQSVLLDGTGSSVGSSFEYEWNGGNILSGNTTLNPLVNQIGIYELSVLSTQNGCVSQAEVLVEGIDDFITNASVFSSDPTCFEENDGSIVIENVMGGTAPYFYTVDSITSTFNTFENLFAGTYQISVLDSEGCTFDTTILINQPIQVMLDLGADQLISLGDSFLLEPQTNIPFLQLDTFYWAFEELMPCDSCYNQWVMPFETTPYELTVVDQNGCAASDDILIRIQKDRQVFIPNIFTPDGDGINDLFMVYGGQDVARVNTFKIFDRWGEMIFQKDNFAPNNPGEGWDGNLKGTPMNPAVFIYFAEIEFIDGRVEIYKGDFTLVRN